jgi:hypothetical protein
MKRINHLTSTASLLVILFLLAPIVCSFLAPLPLNKHLTGVVVSKKATAASKSGLQFQYEEREEEEKKEGAKSHDNLFLICLISETLYQYRTELCHRYSYNNLQLHRSAADLPLYLIKRTLLI